LLLASRVHVFQRHASVIGRMQGRKKAVSKCMLRMTRYQCVLVCEQDYADEPCHGVVLRYGEAKSDIQIQMNICLNYVVRKLSLCQSVFQRRMCHLKQNTSGLCQRVQKDTSNCSSHDLSKICTLRSKLTALFGKYYPASCNSNYD